MKGQWESNRSKNIKLPFPAALENIDKAARKIERFLANVGINDPSKSFNIVLGMREALNNAVMHGCKRDLNKTVSLSLRMENGHLIMEVEDEGEGFDWQTRMKKALPFKEENGRGLAIMKRFFTSVTYNKKGNKLIMKKKI